MGAFSTGPNAVLMVQTQWDKEHSSASWELIEEAWAANQTERLERLRPNVTAAKENADAIMRALDAARFNGSANATNQTHA